MNAPFIHAAASNNWRTAVSDLWSPTCRTEAISRRRHHAAVAPNVTSIVLTAIHAHQVGPCRNYSAASKAVPHVGFTARIWVF